MLTQLYDKLKRYCGVTMLISIGFFITLLLGIRVQLNIYHDEVFKEQNVSRPFGSLVPAKKLTSNLVTFHAKLGDSGLLVTGKSGDEFTILRTEDSKSFLKVRLDDNGSLVFNAKLYFDPTGTCYIAVIDNEYKDIGDCIFSAKQEDSSTLAIKDLDGQKVLEANFIDSSTLKITGTFYKPGMKSHLIVSNDSVIYNGETYSDNTMEGPGTAFVF